MKRMVKIIGFIIIAGMVFSFLNNLKKEEPVQEPIALPTSPFTPPASFIIPPTPPPVISQPQIKEEKKSFNLLFEIQRAQKMLEAEEAGFKLINQTKFVWEKRVVKDRKGREKVVKSRKFVKIWEVVDFRVLLAVQRVEDRKIEIVSIDPKAKNSNPPGYMIDYSRQNGVNTDFTVIYPEGHIVLALKRVVKVKDNQFEEVVYTPYTTEIDSQTIREAGLAYLQKIIGLTRTDLKKRRIGSLAHPGELVADLSEHERITLVLAIIEHIDPNRLGKESIEQLIGEVLTIIGANQNYAYRYSVSTAGARGLFQFISKTYYKIFNFYVDAELEEDFVQGMNNHLNGAKAALLLLDSDQNSLNKLNMRQRDTMVMKKYLAAAYNCGVGRTVGAINTYGSRWESGLRLETQLYLKKFSSIWNILYSS